MDAGSCSESSNTCLHRKLRLSSRNWWRRALSFRGIPTATTSYEVCWSTAPGDTPRAVSLAIGLDIETTMRSRYGKAVVADALTFAAEEDQLALSHALVADGAWLHRGRSGYRHLLAIARRMMELLPADDHV